jgi:hypothetical protein
MAIVLQLPPRPPAPAPRASIPAEARANAECRAAVALAELAGEALETMSIERFADYRRRAVFAMLLGGPTGRRLCAYFLAHAVAREHGCIATLEHHLGEAVEALAGFDEEAVLRHVAALDQAHTGQVPRG